MSFLSEVGFSLSSPISYNTKSTNAHLRDSFISISQNVFKNIRSLNDIYDKSQIDMAIHY